MRDPIREAIKDAFPEWTQSFWTSLTGKPYDGQKAFRTSKWFFLIKSLLCLPLGVLLTFVGMQSMDLIWLIPIAWLVTVHGKSVLRTTVMHYCGHDSFFRLKEDNNRLGELISIIVHAEAIKDYKAKHTRYHHSPKLLTEEEQSYKDWFFFLGMELGESADVLEKRFYSILFSPRYYAKTFLKRMQQVFNSPYPQRTLQAILIWGPIMAMVAVTNSWVLYFVGWWIPCFIFHEACMVCYVTLEHVWVDANVTETDPRRLHQYMTSAIFHGDMPPQATAYSISGLQAWTVWWLRVVFLHIPARLLIVSGDLSVHDYHHRVPTERDWANTIWIRETYEPKGFHDAPFIYNWGIDRAFKNYFRALEKGKPLYPTDNVSKTEESSNLSFDIELAH